MAKTDAMMRRERLAGRVPEMVRDLGELVRVESPSSDREALGACAERVAEIGTRILGRGPTWSGSASCPLLRFGDADAQVLLLAHLDTVHPLGTLAAVPFAERDGKLFGPGVFDMKAGLVQGLYALGDLADASGVALLVTSDEEIGSSASREAIEAAAGSATAVLVLEPASDGKLKTARKGVATYRLTATGRAAHAGLEPELGANACVGLAEAILAVAALADVSSGTTVTPTLAGAGTSSNTVPDSAFLVVDVRAETAEELLRVERAMAELSVSVTGVSIQASGGSSRLPLPESASARLFELAVRAGEELGLEPLGHVHVGGGSDGNLTAALGVETLDGLGAVGGGAHTTREWVERAALGERAGLVAQLIEAVQARGAEES